MHTEAHIIRLMREASGLGMADCRAALLYAETHLQGDFVLALLVRDAASFAIGIRSRDPAISDREARARWNLDHARRRRDSIAASTEDWKTLDALSPRYAP